MISKHPDSSTRDEIEILNLLADYEPMCSDLFSNKHLLEGLEQKGFVEKIHQELANVTRYRLTNAGRIEQESFNFVFV